MVRYKDKGWLQRRYSSKTQAEIADNCQVSVSTISYWMDKFGIDTGPQGNRDHGESPWHDPNWLYEQYWGLEKPSTRIAEEVGTGHSTICRWLNKHNISKREDVVVPFYDHPNGYEYWSYQIGKRDGYGGHTVLHHRLLATLLVDDLEELRGLVVHHRNGVRWDNRESNLMLLTEAEHGRYHANERKERIDELRRTARRGKNRSYRRDTTR